MGVRNVFAAMAVAGVVFWAAGSPPARAQHVVTDIEAGKLTLDALTATPRPIYRPIVAFRRMHRGGYVARAAHVHFVAYRRRMGFRSMRR